MAFDRNDNFYSFWCRETDDGWKYRVACQTKVEKIMAGDSTTIEQFQDCVRAMKRGSCLAVSMAEEEVDKGSTIYYVDRDDRGPGIVCREVPRTPAVIAAHHAILPNLKIVPNNTVTKSAPRRIEAPAVAVEPENAFDVGDLDLGKIITKQVEALRSAA